jgi:hypothetical protein
MFKVEARLINTFKANDFTNKETAETVAGKDKIQLLGQFPVESGEARMELIDFSVDDIRLYKPLQGKLMTVPISMFSNNNRVVYFVPKGSIPKAIQETPENSPHIKSPNPKPLTLD